MKEFIAHRFALKEIIKEDLQANVLQYLPETKIDTNVEINQKMTEKEEKETKSRWEEKETAIKMIF